MRSFHENSKLYERKAFKWRLIYEWKSYIKNYAFIFVSVLVIVVEEIHAHKSLMEQLERWQLKQLVRFSIQAHKLVSKVLCVLSRMKLSNGKCQRFIEDEIEPLNDTIFDFYQMKTIALDYQGKRNMNRFSHFLFFIDCKWKA